MKQFIKIVCALVAVVTFVTISYAGVVMFITEDGAKWQLNEYDALVPFYGTAVDRVETILQVMNRILLFDFNAQFDRHVYNAETIGCWTLNPADITQGSRFSFDSQDVKNYGFGSCIKIRYDVDCKGEAVNGFFVRPKKTHISNCDFLSLWVRGSDHFGFTEKFKVGIKNDAGDKFEFLLEGITGDWQNYLVALRDVKMINKWSTITEIYTVFNSEAVTQKKGVIYLDHIEYLTVTRL